MKMTGILMIFKKLVFRNRTELGHEEAGFLYPAHKNIRMFLQVMVQGGCAAPAHSDDQEVRQRDLPALSHQEACSAELA